MASKAKSTDPTQPSTVVEERERLLQSTREQEIRNRAYETYLRGAQPGYEVRLIAADVKEVVLDSGHFVPEERPQRSVSKFRAARAPGYPNRSAASLTDEYKMPRPIEPY